MTPGGMFFLLVLASLAQQFRRPQSRNQLMFDRFCARIPLALALFQHFLSNRLSRLSTALPAERSVVHLSVYPTFHFLEVRRMQVLKRGHTELFRRGPDECYDSLADLSKFCQDQKTKSVDRWLPPRSLRPRPLALDRLVVDFADAGADGANGTYQMNDWSFTQLCQLARVSRDTVNRVTADTAWRILGDTLPDGNKPLQLYTEGDMIRSIHGVSYTRLYNADILAMLAEFATDFQPPQKAAFGGKDESGGTGLYAG